MKDGKCTKGYPKPLVEVTQGNVNGFPVCRRRRRPPGVLKFKGREYDNATINQWVVPYNPYLSQKYNCHINVEVCTALTAVKYLYKYVYKGSDKAVITVETVGGESNGARMDPNEILRYLNARYISPIEACMRLLDFSVQGKTHSIVQLTIHLENEQFVTFRSSDNPDRVLTRGRHSMLTRFFELCASEAPENQVAKTMVYQDIPKLFRWDDKAKKWVRRKQYQAALGRMVHVTPRDMERFYMRVLLCHRKGPQSFAKLRTVDGVTYASYRQAALKLGYLEDDAEWIACMEEAAAFKMPYQLRQLFATIIVYSQVSEVRVLWNRFYDVLSEDFAHTYRGLEGQEKEDMIRFHTLKDLNDLLQINGYVVADFDLPQLDDYPRLVLDSLLRNNLIRRELEGYQHSTLQAIVDQESQLNDGQRAIYDEIIQAAEAPVQGNKLFFIDGPGGTGKSTLLRHILAKVRLSGKIAIAVASSGIASLLLMGGRTAHSTFKIPLKLNDKSTCAIYKQSRLKMLIERASLVIWDEAPMTHRHAFEAVDRSLRDIMGNDQEPFGGKVFVLSGDFRQILPVVVRGTPAETIGACLKSSTLWRHFKQLHLTENMRVQSASNESTAAELAAFSEFLLQVGEGRHEVNRSLGRDFVKIPRDMLIDNIYEEGDDIEDEEITPGAVPRGLKNIIDKMYADINDPEVATDEYFANRTILTTTNAVVHRINQAVSERLSGEAREYLSVDSVDDDNEGNFFEPEVLHSVTINGIPPHKLTLKEGAPIMMMRNLNPDLGLCNGTRLRVVQLKPHVIHATIMTGERIGQNVLIPRIVFVSDGDAREFPFRLRRKQFPVVPAFAMTINKAQGQTVQNLGLYLATPCFSHGQLYVALSRVTSRSKFKALIEYPELEEDDGAYTDNIVYRQIFEDA
ncbi:helitron helicase-like protein [Phytophthora cinnamomi]|uniref:helitron helicase-like protein n=1 Tax=Phytophthora cinnamomi TaxID=4785 RepID=UPI003559B20B|nr:helitron helicase-like protein [Phytophthora cinnamomi]